MAGQMVPEEIVQHCRIMACTCVCAIPSVCADFAFACTCVRGIPSASGCADFICVCTCAGAVPDGPVVALVFKLVFFWFTLARVL